MKPIFWLFFLSSYYGVIIVSATLSNYEDHLNDGYVIVFDAGSTGTRVTTYKKSSSEFDKLWLEEVTELKPGLSSQSVNSAYEYLRPALYKAQSLIPTEAIRFSEVYILGTAGMRTLSTSTQEELYNKIYTESFLDNDLKLQIKRHDVKTISGTDEGIYGAFALNFLTEGISRTLSPGNSELYGALDLGGSSTQIVFDAKERWRLRHARGRRKSLYHPLSREDFFVNSFKQYGVNAMEASVTSSLYASGGKNPCMFKGSIGAMEGTGNALECIAAINTVVTKDNRDCPIGQYCALSSQVQPVPRGKFYAFSTYAFAVLFASDVLTHEHNNGRALDLSLAMPNPSVIQLSHAVDYICSANVSELTTVDSPLTPLERLPRRCFDMCYVLVLLRQFKFSDLDRRVYFTEKVGDKRLSWSLGFYLHHGVQSFNEAQRLMAQMANQTYQNGLPIAFRFTLLVAFAVILYLVYEVRRIRRSRHKYFVFYKF